MYNLVAESHGRKRKVWVNIFPKVFKDVFKVTEYTECHAFSPVVRIGSPHPLTLKRVLPPLVPRGDTLARGRDAGGANSYEGTDTLEL